MFSRLLVNNINSNGCCRFEGVSISVDQMWCPHSGPTLKCVYIIIYTHILLFINSVRYVNFNPEQTIYFCMCLLYDDMSSYSLLDQSARASLLAASCSLACRGLLHASEYTAAEGGGGGGGGSNKWRPLHKPQCISVNRTVCWHSFSDCTAQSSHSQGIQDDLLACIVPHLLAKSTKDLGHLISQSL